MRPRPTRGRGSETARAADGRRRATGSRFATAAASAGSTSAATGPKQPERVRARSRTSGSRSLNSPISEGQPRAAARSRPRGRARRLPHGGAAVPQGLVERRHDRRADLREGTSKGVLEAGARLDGLSVLRNEWRTDGALVHGRVEQGRHGFEPGLRESLDRLLERGGVVARAERPADDRQRGPHAGREVGPHLLGLRADGLSGSCSAAVRPGRTSVAALTAAGSRAARSSAARARTARLSSFTASRRAAVTSAPVAPVRARSQAAFARSAASGLFSPRSAGCGSWPAERDENTTDTARTTATIRDDFTESPAGLGGTTTVRRNPAGDWRSAGWWMKVTQPGQARQATDPCFVTPPWTPDSIRVRPPSDPFTLFNLGSDFNEMGDYRSAVDANRGVWQGSDREGLDCPQALRDAPKVATLGGRSTLRPTSFHCLLVATLHSETDRSSCGQSKCDSAA